MSQEQSRRPTAVTSVDDPQPSAPRAVGFRDRRDAGRKLAALLEPVRSEQPVVVGIPRGGVPVAAPAAVQALAQAADQVVCVDTPEDLWAVGQWYDDFKPPADEEIATLLAERGAASGPGPHGRHTQSREITIQLERDVSLGGE